jgi:chitin disaccharide deacetylase
MKPTQILLLSCFFLFGPPASGPFAAEEKASWAERLGWPRGARLIILHVDDAGMSHDSNAGTIEAMEKGVASSTSIMMPCPWVPEIIAYVKSHPGMDAGLHITLNSEWKLYRWAPLAGKTAVPGLVDQEGCLWRDSMQVARSASAEEVEREIRAQLDRAKSMGFQPTHLDSHMGTVIMPPFFERYVKIGMETGIPIMLPAGHMQHVGERVAGFRDLVLGAARQVWESGLPLLDDIIAEPTIGKDYQEMKAFLMDQLRNMKPGISQVIVHCTRPSETFSYISNSGEKRFAELRLMMDPEIKSFLTDQGIQTTTWIELMKRRKQAATSAF